MGIEMAIITRSHPVTYFQHDDDKWTGKVIKPQNDITDDVNYSKGSNLAELNLS